MLIKLLFCNVYVESVFYRQTYYILSERELTVTYLPRLQCIPTTYCFCGILIQSKTRVVYFLLGKAQLCTNLTLPSRLLFSIPFYRCTPSKMYWTDFRWSQINTLPQNKFCLHGTWNLSARLALHSCRLLLRNKSGHSRKGESTRPCVHKIKKRYRSRQPIDNVSTFHESREEKTSRWSLIADLRVCCGVKTPRRCWR